ncbi:hypothetical protein ACVGVM_18225 [Pseudonocardia bannensis]|uniref:Uncharacterized protein n=1 Tax=Pseudonocardia bannensis TaxID=630973 RepID=A0A848DLN7_9PSEU|nr:hypothetical protein [Pseudonocardia bannensis]NMH93667.1 hypothetical protein [Pseudonocardia bannensis]
MTVLKPGRTMALLLLAGLLAGCGGSDQQTAPAPAPPAAPSTTATATPSPEPSAGATPGPTSATPRAGGGSGGSGGAGGGGGAHEGRSGATLLWPVTDPAEVAPLQARVDGGAQPWLLDPAEVAVAFAGATYGWGAPEAGSVSGGTVVVNDAAGGRATVTVVQPGRTGATGIWVVSAASRS